jgi:polysaccharide pyruvyl transferase WcaK-like protein
MNILVVNLHAMSNRGDAAIAFVTLDLLKQAFVDPEITCAANHPAEFQSLGVEVVPSFKTWVWSADAAGKPSWHPLKFALLLLAALNLLLCRATGYEFLPWPADRARLLRAYLRADLVIGCGGNTIYARRARALAFWVICFSQWCGYLCQKTVVCLPQTIGPFYSGVHAFGARLALRKARTIMLRDTDSYQIVTWRLKIEPSRCCVMPDLALLLGGPEHAAPRDAQLIGISALDWQVQYPHFHRQGAYEAALAGAIARLAQQGFRIAFFKQSDTATVGEDDAVPARRIIDRLDATARRSVVGILTVPSDAQHIRDFYAQFYLVIATRLHATILAIVAGTPVVPIAYTSKSWGFARDYGLEHITIDIETVSEQALFASIAAVIEQYDYWSVGYQATIRQRISDEKDRVIQLLRSAKALPAKPAAVSHGAE